MVFSVVNMTLGMIGSNLCIPQRVLLIAVHLSSTLPYSAAKYSLVSYTPAGVLK